MGDEMEKSVVSEEFAASLRYADKGFPEALQRVIRHLACENHCDMSTLEIREDAEGSGLRVLALRERARVVAPGLPGQYIDKDEELDDRAMAKRERAEHRAARRAESRIAQGLPPAA